MCSPKCGQDCKHRGTFVIHWKYRSSEVTKSFVISIIDRNVYRWVTAKGFSQHVQERRPIWSVASNCLTNIYDTVSPNVIQKQTKWKRKIAFTIENEIEAEGLSCPKSIGILTVLRCISRPDLVIVAETGDKLSCGQAQNEVKFDFHVKLDLEGQGRSPPKIKRIFTKVFCTYVSNWVILA